MRIGTSIREYINTENMCMVRICKWLQVQSGNKFIVTTGIVIHVNSECVKN